MAWCAAAWPVGQRHLDANEHVHRLLGIMPIDTSLFVKARTPCCPTPARFHCVDAVPVADAEPARPPSPAVARHEPARCAPVTAATCVCGSWQGCWRAGRSPWQRASSATANSDPLPPPAQSPYSFSSHTRRRERRASDVRCAEGSRAAPTPALGPADASARQAWPGLPGDACESWLRSPGPVRPSAVQRPAATARPPLTRTDRTLIQPAHAGPRAAGGRLHNCTSAMVVRSASGGTSRCTHMRIESDRATIARSR